MPHKKKPRRFIAPLVLFTLAGWALWALGRNEPEVEQTSDAGSSTGPREASSPAPAARQRATWSKRRLATSLAFATLFFGGAAFSAGAGDVVAEAIEGGDTTTEVTSTEEEASEEPADAEEQPAEEGEQPADEGEQPAEEGEQPAEGEEPTENGEEPAEGGEEPSEEGETPGDGETPPPLPGEEGDNGGDPGDGEAPPPLPEEPSEGGDNTPDEPQPQPGVGDGPGSDPAPDELPVIDKTTRSGAELDPEVNADGFFATIWLHRPLPDPTPPAKRLKPAFAAALAREARAAKVDWALVLGALRARGFDSSSMSIGPVRSTARQLAAKGAGRNMRWALGAYGGREFAKQAWALRNYNRGVGLQSLVDGFEASKGRLQRLVLRDKRLVIYPGGRLDVAMGRVDVRLLVLLRYLAEAHGQATVSSLISGHRLYSRPGVISAHVYGLAVDVAALANRSIYGNQERGGLTERAVQNILLLPSELQAKQVISLLGLGGPSFPLADHDDHIHVGY
jgi:hypothetical protein